MENLSKRANYNLTNEPSILFYLSSNPSSEELISDLSFWFNLKTE